MGSLSLEFVQPNNVALRFQPGSVDLLEVVVSRQRSDSRAKIVDAARTLLRRQGYHGTGLAQIIDLSGAPRGSVYFLFPGGKEEIAAAAVELSTTSIPDLIRQASGTCPTLAAWIQALVSHFAEQLVESQFNEGCPITTIALDTVPSSEPLSRACRQAYDAWLVALAHGLRSYGVPLDVAPAVSETLLACVEGALVLCRVQRSTQPLDRTSEQMILLASSYTRG